MKSAVALVAGFGLLAFGLFLVVIAQAVGMPSGEDDAAVFTRGLVTVAVVLGGVCTVAGAVAGVLGLVGMRRAERRRRAEAAEVARPAGSGAGPRDGG